MNYPDMLDEGRYQEVLRDVDMRSAAAGRRSGHAAPDSIGYLHAQDEADTLISYYYAIAHQVPELERLDDDIADKQHERQEAIRQHNKACHHARAPQHTAIRSGVVTLIAMLPIVAWPGSVVPYLLPLVPLVVTLVSVHQTIQRNAANPEHEFAAALAAHGEEINTLYARRAALLAELDEQRPQVAMPELADA